MSDELLKEIAQSLVKGDREATASLTRDALAAGIAPLTVIDEGLVPGMREVGERFDCGEYFLPNLMIAAQGMKQAMALIEPELRSRGQSAARLGTVVIGTVRGDIHEIGKSLVASMLAANGFEVHDLGVDVPVERFIAAVQEHGANLVGLSALLTTTMGVQRKVLKALADAGLRDGVKVMVGGAPVTRNRRRRLRARRGIGGGAGRAPRAHVILSAGGFLFLVGSGFSRIAPASVRLAFPRMMCLRERVAVCCDAAGTAAFGSWFREGPASA
jgi:corrinoid protein of di/trimethylamine methyltransferase